MNGRRAYVKDEGTRQQRWAVYVEDATGQRTGMGGLRFGQLTTANRVARMLNETYAAEGRLLTEEERWG